LLSDFVQAARRCFGADLRTVVLFGSAAEGRLRPTSDLNLLLVLRRFERSQTDEFRAHFRLARSAARAAVMFLTEPELPAAAEAFAVKFGDVARRHRILWGDDLLSALRPSRAAMKTRLTQMLLNLTLRLRERYAAEGPHEEQIALAVAEAAGPLRAAAAALCELEGVPFDSPRAALEAQIGRLGGTGTGSLAGAITAARQGGRLPPGQAPQTLFDLIHLTEALRGRVEHLD